jgi:hypothetical protein
MRVFPGIKSIAKRVIPAKYHHIFGEMRRWRISLFLYGYRFTCPICGGHFRKLLPFGVKPRPNTLCPRCGSLERHRLLWLYLKDKTNLFADNLKFLDIAPMDCLTE